MRLLVVFLGLLTATLLNPVQVHATTYHVADSTNSSALIHWGGMPSDANDGLSWSTAWSSIDRVNTALSVGDTVLFSTGIWYNTQIHPPEYGDGNHWTVYACSSFTASSDENRLNGKFRAKLYGGTLVTGWQEYNMSNGKAIYRAQWVGSDCYYDEQCYTLGQDDTLQLVPQSGLTTGGIVDKPGEMYHDDGTNYIYAWLYGSANPNECTMIASCKAVMYSRVSFINCVKFWGLEMKYGKQGVIHLGGRNDSVKIEHCHVAMSGMKDHENPAVIFSSASSSYSAEYCGVVACSLGWALNEYGGRPAEATFDPPRNGYGHGGIIDLYSQEHFHVDSNYIYGYAALGVSFKNSDYACCEPWTGNVVRFNTIKNIKDGILFYNYPDRDSAYGNIVSDCYEYGITIQSGASDNPDYYEGKIYIANNTIYNCDVACINLRGGTTELCGSDNEVKYNICQKWNQVVGNEGESFIIGFNPRAHDTCEYSYTIDSNLYYNGDVVFRGRCAESNGYTWQDWTTACGKYGEGFDHHSDTTNPGLNNPEGGDFSRPNAIDEMNVLYGGRVWTRFGAWQVDNGVPNPDSIPLTIYSINVTNITTSSAQISWTTNKPATSQVEYGTTSGYGSVSAYDPDLKVSHFVTLTGLEANAIYHFRVHSIDNIGQQGTSSDNTFLTTDPASPSGNIALGITPTVSGTYAGYDATAITDGVINPYGGTNTTWASNDNTEPHWIEIDFGSNHDVNLVRIFWAWNNSQDNLMLSQQFNIQEWNGAYYEDIVAVSPYDTADYSYSSDSTMSVCFHSIGGTKYTDDYVVTFTGLTPFSTSRLRIYQPESMGPHSYPSIMWISEVEVYYDNTAPSSSIWE